MLQRKFFQGLVNAQTWLILWIIGQCIWYAAYQTLFCPSWAQGKWPQLSLESGPESGSPIFTKYKSNNFQGYICEYQYDPEPEADCLECNHNVDVAPWKTLRGCQEPIVSYQLFGAYDMSHIIWVSIIEYFSISMKSYKSPHFSWNMGSEISGKIIGVITIGRMRLWKLNKMNFTCSLLLFDCFAVLGQGSMDWPSVNWLWTLQGALIKKIGCLVALAEKHVMYKMRDYHFHTI